MKRGAYLTTGLAIKALSGLSKAKVFIHGKENIPDDSTIFVINHFTRIETLLLPYHIYILTRTPVWSLASDELFKGPLTAFFDSMGVVSTKDPNRDQLIVKSLLTGEANWVIFPEGQMVKSKQVYRAGQKENRFMIDSSEGSRPPHTGAATIALRTEFYRERIRRMQEINSFEEKRLLELYQIESVVPVLERTTCIVPVNVTYYPLRARENLLTGFAESFVNKIPDRAIDELMTEGSMLLSGVDVDVRFGEPIKISQYMKSAPVKKDIEFAGKINFDDPIASKQMMKASVQNIMERYMSSIYLMTTINHDHLFASILKYMPFGEIDEYDLRLRVYLAAVLYVDRKMMYCHKSLLGNQIHILTDDCYGKCDNFISLAVEKGVVRKNGSKLIKDEAFDSPVDFHRVRVENPVTVITNELEPLTELRDRIKELAQQPALRVKYRVTKHLMENAKYGFEQDYLQYFIEGESKARDVGMPYFLQGTSRDIGILLIHGYMASPLEMKELADYLNSRGHCVYVPRLKGHGTSPEDLAQTTYTDWVDSVDEGYTIVRSMCKKIIVGGFSTGAGLALDLSARIGPLAGVFAVAPPLKLQDFSSRFVPAVNLWNWIMHKTNLEIIKKEFVENNPENPHINYFRNPVSGILELERLMDAIEPKLPGIKVPALVIQAFGDPVVNHKGTMKVYELLGSHDKEYLILNFDRHGILLGEDAFRVHKPVGDFVERVGKR